MAIGAQDYIDKLLVKKYADEKVDNHEMVESLVKPEDMMTHMNNAASTQMHMALLANKLSISCYNVNARLARYKKGAKFDNEAVA